MSFRFFILKYVFGVVFIFKNVLFVFFYNIVLINLECFINSFKTIFSLDLRSFIILRI